MAWDAEPVVGQWYRHLDKDYEFKVVSMDENEGIVEIQYLDDEVEQLDIDSWYEWDIEPIAPYDKVIRTRDGLPIDDDIDNLSGNSDVDSVGEDEDEDDDLESWEDR